MKYENYEQCCKECKKPGDWIEEYLNLHPEGIWMEAQSKKSFSKWFLVKSFDDFDNSFNTRQVLPEELVLDIDSDDINRAKEVANLLCERLNDVKFNYSLWKSGGKGYHIHIFFPELLEHKTNERITLKKKLTKWIAGEYFKKDVCTSNCSSKTLIALERAKHRKSGKPKSLILFGHNREDKNKIPEDVLINTKQELKSWEKIDFIPIIDGDTPPCIKFIMGEEFASYKECRGRALFVLTSFYMRQMTNEEVYIKLKGWRDKVLKGYTKITNYKIKATIASNKGAVGCPYRKELLDEIGINKCTNCKYVVTQQ